MKYLKPGSGIFAGADIATTVKYRLKREIATGGMGAIYKVRDKIISYIDTESLYSRYFYKRLREGDYKKTVEINFDHPAEEAHYTGGDTYPISEGVQDVLSAIYFARNLDLDVGDVYEMKAHSSRKTYDLKIVVHGKERVEVEAGTWDCYVVEPLLEGEGLFKHEGKVTMYITDDAHRIPVLVKTLSLIHISEPTRLC